MSSKVNHYLNDMDLNQSNLNKLFEKKTETNYLNI